MTQPTTNFGNSFKVDDVVFNSNEEASAYAFLVQSWTGEPHTKTTHHLQPATFKRESLGLLLPAFDHLVAILRQPHHHIYHCTGWMIPYHDQH